MRITTLAAVLTAALSTAALAQVASTPAEQKVPAPGSEMQGNDMAMPGNESVTGNTADIDTNLPSTPAATPPSPEPNKTRPRLPR